MKKIIRTFKIILPLLAFTSVSHAQDDEDNDRDNRKDKKYEFVKKKDVSKSFNVTPTVKLEIENSFGSVEVHTWEKNEIKVDVNVEVSANTEAVAQRILDDIEIKHSSDNGKKIWFKTDSDLKKSGKNEQSSMHINYNVYMPAGNPLEIENSFGSTILPDFRGEVELTSKFGKLNTGDLSSVKNIHVEFGKAKLGSVPGGDINIKFSKATIDRLGGKAKVNLEFCGKVFLNLDNNINSLDLKAQYSTVNVKPMGSVPADYNITTSFGSFKNRTAVKFTSDEESDDGNRGPKFDNEYNGKSGGGTVPVKIKSSFSTIVLGEPTGDDMKEKDKNKNKNKDKAGRRTESI